MDDCIHGRGGPVVQEDIWLLEAADPANNSCGGPVNDRSGRFKSKQSELYSNLDHCNKALQKLMLENTALRNKICLAAASDGGDKVVPVMKSAHSWSAPSSSKQKSFRPKRLLQDSSSSLESSSSSESTEDDLGCQWLSTMEDNSNALVRPLDQEIVVCAYRNLLGEMDGQIGSMESQMGWLQMQAERLRTAAAIQEQLHEHEALSSEIERLMLLDKIMTQADEAENKCQELRQQLDVAKRRARRDKNRADARIAELKHSIETSHIDVQSLRNENMVLREQIPLLPPIPRYLTGDDFEDESG